MNEPDHSARAITGRRGHAATTRSAGILISLALILLAGYAPESHANGHVNATNCSTTNLTLCAYDWDDAVMLSPRESAAAATGKTAKPACRKSWSSSNAPGCKIAIGVSPGCSGSGHIGRIYSGYYTMYMTTSGKITNFLIQPGTAADCNGGVPDQFTISGSELSGCSSPPRIVLHDTPDMSGDSYVLENAALEDMTRASIGTFTSVNEKAEVFSLNDRTRAIELTSGKWEICEDIKYGGKCLGISGDGVSGRLDRIWSGNWDSKISSIRPKACE